MTSIYRNKGDISIGLVDKRWALTHAIGPVWLSSVAWFNKGMCLSPAWPDSVRSLNLLVYITLLPK